MIEFQHVSKEYVGGTHAVTDLSVTAPTGKITVLVGPSGCGKTTTLRMINRLVEPTSGKILLGGEDSAAIDRIEMRRQIGYVIQNAGLFPHQTVLDNICAVPYLQKVKARDAHARAYELLELVGLDESYARRYPWQLSGGQQQRVGVARALAADPPYMLMDEPFSAVDPIVRKQLQLEFLKIQADLAKTIVMVTHDIDEALRLGDQIVVLEQGGIIAQVGAPAELLARPANAFVADFLGSSRGYHALGFAAVSGLEPRATPSVAVTHDGTAAGWGLATDADEAWVVATDAQQRPLGWTRAGATPDNAVITAADPISISEGNRRQLLDAALSSPHGQAILIADDGTYIGTMEIDDIVRATVSGARENVPSEPAPASGHTQ